MEDAKTEIYPTAEVGLFGLTRSSPQGGARMRGNVRKQICVQLARPHTAFPVLCNVPAYSAFIILASDLPYCTSGNRHSYISFHARQDTRLDLTTRGDLWLENKLFEQDTIYYSVGVPTATVYIFFQKCSRITLPVYI